jgi:light-regulated signal transduction histidine kinase (bacteriophytochrome)
LERAAQEGECADEGWRVRRGGSLFWARIVITGLKDSTGIVRAFSKFTRDNTPQKKAEDELKRSNADLEQFAYVASHDLQEPLRMVSNYTQLLEQRYRGRLDSDADEFIGFAVDGARRMQTLIDDLLEYSRVGRRGKEPRPFDSGQILQNALANLKSAVEESGARVEFDALPVMACDTSQMEKVFQNLIGNALKFRREGNPCVVRVSASEKVSESEFCIQDNGIGIESRHFERIFQVFQRLHTREKYPGTGIGLAICKKIIERHGGRIWLESSPGDGTKFFFTVPTGRAEVTEDILPTSQPAD